MITVKKGVDLIAAIGNSFNYPNVQAQKAGNEGYSKIATVVQKVNANQLKQLAKMAEDSGANIELKRSGTGIAIHFN